MGNVEPRRRSSALPRPRYTSSLVYLKSANRQTDVQTSPTVAPFEFFATATRTPFVSTHFLSFRIDDIARAEVSIDQSVHFFISLPGFFDVSHDVKTCLASRKRRQNQPFIGLAAVLVRHRHRPQVPGAQFPLDRVARPRKLTNVAPFLWAGSGTLTSCVSPSRRVASFCLLAVPIR